MLSILIHISHDIGRFDLDPNRVLDLILDSYQDNLWNDCYIQIMSDAMFKKANIPQLVGFKFQYFQVSYPFRYQSVNRSLYQPSICISYKSSNDIYQ